MRNLIAQHLTRWIVCAGPLQFTFAAAHHAEQMARALRLNGLCVTVREVRS